MRHIPLAVIAQYRHIFWILYDKETSDDLVTFFADLWWDGWNFNSSSLSLGTEGFICGKWIIDYNLGIDDNAELRLGTHKELIVINILKYKYFVIKSRDMSRDHFPKNRKLLAN